MSYTYTDKDNLIEKYGPEADMLDLNNKIALFGNPGLPGGNEISTFRKNNIVTIEVDGFGENVDTKFKLTIHKKLSKLITNIFKQIKKLNLSKDFSYTLHTNQCWSFAHRMIRGYEKQTTLGYLSNHSWGTAIDINSSSNAFKSKTWDMPPEIVKIFARHGFYWGGFFLDAMHFEYGKKTIIPVPLSFVLPTSSDFNKEIVCSLYTNSETKTSNFYPITEYGWWHNGVHLPGKDNEAIQAIANGKLIYVSISRESENEYGSPNFILLQHEMSIDDQTINFYSMYMHLQKIDIEKNLDESKKIPDWIKRKFYYNEKILKPGLNGVVEKTYTENGITSLTLYEKETNNSKIIEELNKGDHFEIIKEPKGNFVKVRTTKNNEGYIYYANDSISCKCLHKWALDSNGQIKDSIFKVPRTFSDPIDVYAGEVIGYMGKGLEHIEVVNHSKAITQLKPILHFEIFSRNEHNDGKDIYDYLNSKPENYFILEEENDAIDVIAEPDKEKMQILETLKKKDPNFVDYLQTKFPEAFQETESFIFWERIVLKDDEVQYYMNEYKEQFRDCVSKHISTWQAIGNKITYHTSDKEDLLEGLDAFHLFKSEEQGGILDENETLFFYHPIKFIEILTAVLNPETEAETEVTVVPKEDNDCIKDLKTKGIVNNKPFRHDDPVKRCEFLKMLLLSLEYEIPDKNSITCDFTDVKPNDWFSPYVYVANLCKIAQGYRDTNGNKTGTFGPFDNTTIYQALKMAEVAQFGYEANKRNVYEIDGKKTGNDIVTREQAANLICQLLNDNVSEHITNRRDELIRRIEGPKTSETNQKIMYSVVEYAQASISQEKKNQISWAVKDEKDNSEIDSFKGIGEKLEYTPSRNLNNKAIRVIAYTNKPSLETSVTTFLGNIRFFIKQKDTKNYISYSDVTKKEFFGTNIYAEQNGQEELFARITRYGKEETGYRYGLTTIYNGNDRPRPTVSNYSNSRQKIAAAVSNNEGSYVDTQSYDTGILSHGTTQWTLASKNLHLLINDYKAQKPELFNQYFISNGVDINETTFYINDDALGASTVTFQLAYYLWKSGYVPEFQEIQFNNLASRIDSFYPGHPKYNDISKYYTSENSIAHLLDLNVNRPAYVPGVAQKAVDEFKKQFKDKGDPNSWTDDDEKQLIKIFLNIRLTYGEKPMTKSQERATNINNISALSKVRNSYQ